MFNDIWIFIYIFIYILPFSVPRFYLFMNCLILPPKWIAAILVSLAVISAVVFVYLNKCYWFTEMDSLIYRYTYAFISAIISILLIKEKFSKVIFIYFIMFCYDGFILGNSHFIEARFFPYLSLNYPYLVNDIVKIILIILTYPILFYFLKNHFKSLMEITDNYIWKYIWLIPLIFSIIGAVYSSTYSNANYSKFSFIFLRYLVFIGTFVTCYILLKALKQSELNIRLEDNIKYIENQVKMQKEHYVFLNKNIEEIKRAKHDLRHHILLIQTLLYNKEYNKLENYLLEYQKSLKLDNELTVCKNYIVNSILNYYINLAENEKININVDLKIPDKTFVSDLDFCIIIGNCLENAIESCRKIVGNEKFISIKSQITDDIIGITIDNSFTGEIVKENLAFISTKNSINHGIGISSVHAIVSKYDGIDKFEIDDFNKIFKVSILLNNMPKSYSTITVGME